VQLPAAPSPCAGRSSLAGASATHRAPRWWRAPRRTSSGCRPWWSEPGSSPRAWSTSTWRRPRLVQHAPLSLW